MSKEPTKEPTKEPSKAPSKEIDIDSIPDPIPGEITEFMDFFRASLAELAFPDLDLSSLDTRAQEVRAGAQKLAELTEEVRLAREALERARTELDEHARRGLAYVSVYARGDEELSRKVAALGLAREADAANAPKKRKSRKRSKGENKTRKPTTRPTAELPFSDDAPPADKSASEAA